MFVLIPWLREDFDVNSYVRNVVTLHFGPEGSEYAHDLLKKGVRPEDLCTLDDCRAILPLEKDGIILEHDSEYFIPKKLLKEEPQKLVSGRSSGTTGPQKTVPWHADTVGKVMEWMDWNFDRLRLPRGRDLLYVGPNGLFQDGMEAIAARRGGKGVPVILDNLGEVKKAFSAPESRRGMAAYIADKIVAAMKNENNVGTVVSLGPPLEYLKEMGDISKVDAFVVGGFGTTPEEYRKLKHQYDGKVLQETYGNIFWFWAFNTDDAGGNLNYSPQYPHFSFDAVDPDTGKSVGYGNEGQVAGMRITKELLFRWKERDAGILLRGTEEMPWNGIKNIRPVSAYLSEKR